jgi:hypothetical protein
MTAMGAVWIVYRLTGGVLRMNKVMTVGFAAAMVAGIAGAQNDMSVVGLPPANGSAEPEVSAAAALLSSYVWRGQVLNADAVFQPQITVSKADFSLNVWGNYDLAGSSSSGVSDDLSELDLSLAYTLPVDVNDMMFDIGAIYYSFPNSVAESTIEIYGRATVTTWEEASVPVIPSVTIFGDIDEVSGVYVLFDVNVPYAVSDVLDVTTGLSAGYGNTSYNDAYFATGTDAGWNDYNVYAVASYEISESVTAELNLTYTMLEGGAIEDGAKDNYDASQKFWGGFGIAYDF